MENFDLKKLKSGTDIRGTAVAENADGVELSDAAVGAIVSAFAFWLKEIIDKTPVIAVGRDSRISGERLKAACIDGLKSAGAEILDCGLCSTPSIFMMTQIKAVNADAGVMLTASHHPFDKNGLKFFTKAGGIDSADLDKIIDYARAGKRLAAKSYKYVKKDFLRYYCDFLTGFIIKSLGGADATPLKGLKIAVDAGNGAGGFFAERVLKPLGADVSASQFLEPDGNFPNHVPNPENAAAMASISERTVKTGADLGVIFDADADRSAVTDFNGAEINRNRLIALAAASVLADAPGAVIVTDSVTSDGLTEFIERRGGVHRRYKRGYKNVINEAVRLNAAGVNAPLAIETSGHAAFRENYFLDDGAYLAAKLIIEAVRLKRYGKNLTDLIAGLKEPKETAEVRLAITAPDFAAAGKSIIGDLDGYAAKRFRTPKENYEGVRANIDAFNGLFIARMSVHDPIIAVNIESDAVGGVKRIAAELCGFFQEYEVLDLSGLEALRDA